MRQPHTTADPEERLIEVLRLREPLIARIEAASSYPRELLADLDVLDTVMLRLWGDLTFAGRINLDDEPRTEPCAGCGARLGHLGGCRYAGPVFSSAQREVVE